MDKSAPEKPAFRTVQRTIFRLYGTTRDFLGWGILRALGGVASASLGICGNWVVGQTLDVALSGEMARVLRFAALVGGVVVARGLVNYVNVITAQSYEVRSGRKLRTLAMEKINSLPIRYYETAHTGKNVSRLTSDVERMQEFCGNSIAGIWSYVPTNFVVGLIVLLSMSVPLTIICTAVIPLLSLLIGKASAGMEGTSKRRQESMADLNSLLRDFIEGIPVYKAFNMHRHHGARFEAACAAVTRDSVELANKRSVSRGLSALGAILPQILSYAIGGYFVLRGELTIGELFAFTQILFPFISTYRTVALSWTSMVETAGLAGHFFALLDEADERTGGTGGRGIDSGPVLAFRDVTYGYHENTPVLSGLSFSAQRGTKVALVGPSGCGKTTVQKLLCGYYDNYAGSIEIMGTELRAWDLGLLRASIAVVTQDVYLFSDTVRENIRYGRPEATDAEVEEAARKAYAHEFITGLPQGYATPIGERGARLSGGERQRIAVARAMLKDARLVVLDEPTSALDTKAEHYVQQAIEKLESGRTVLVIAHRLSAIKNADTILVLNAGRIVEAGRHDELLAASGRYAELYARQAAEEGGVA